MSESTSQEPIKTTGGRRRIKKTIDAVPSGASPAAEHAFAGSLSGNASASSAHHHHHHHAASSAAAEAREVDTLASYVAKKLSPRGSKVAAAPGNVHRRTSSASSHRRDGATKKSAARFFSRLR